jgi:hypothetical protein
MKIRPVGVELFLAVGQTDRHEEAKSHFSQFARAPKKGFYGAVSNDVQSIMNTCQMVKILN